MVKFKPKDIGITKKQLKNPLNSTFEKVKDLDQQGKTQVMAAMWQGIGPLKGFGKGFDEVQEHINKTKKLLKQKKELPRKLEKKLLASWSTGIGVPKQQKNENYYYQTLIKELKENMKNNLDEKRSETIIQELEQDLNKSRDEMQLNLAYKLQILKKPKA